MIKAGLQKHQKSQKMFYGKLKKILLVPYTKLVSCVGARTTVMKENLFNPETFAKKVRVIYV